LGCRFFCGLAFLYALVKLAHQFFVFALLNFLLEALDYFFMLLKSAPLSNVLL